MKTLPKAITFDMRSKIAKRIQDETPKEVSIFVRQYTDIVVRINEIMVAKGILKKILLIKCKKNLQRLTNG